MTVALLAYRTAYLRTHHRAEFLAALLNARGDRLEAVREIVADARSRGFELRPVDVQRSTWDHAVEGDAVRVGLQLVRGLMTGNEGGLSGKGNVIGDLFYGDNGWMALDGAGFQVYKGEGSEKIMDVKAEKENSAHVANFLKAARSRNYKDLTADVEIGVTSATLVHISNISYRLKRRLNFDPAGMKFVGDAEANQMLTRKYRAPYIVPEKV